jgi:uncharacterized protein YggE
VRDERIGAVPTDQSDPIANGAAPTVTVRGEAVVRTEPDEAVLWITVSVLEESPDKALADVARRSEAVMHLLDELKIEKADRSTTGMTAREEFDHTPRGRRSLGHRAAASVSVRFADPELIGKVITGAIDASQASIVGPRWFVSADNPSRLEAAKLAAANATRRAEAYAAGAGGRLGRLIRLSETGDHEFTVMRSSRVASVELSAGSPEMPIEPGEHEVTAVVEATFALEIDTDETRA